MESLLENLKELILLLLDPNTIDEAILQNTIYKVLEELLLIEESNPLLQEPEINEFYEKFSQTLTSENEKQILLEASIFLALFQEQYDHSLIQDRQHAAKRKLLQNIKKLERDYRTLFSKRPKFKSKQLTPEQRKRKQQIEKFSEKLTELRPSIIEHYQYGSYITNAIKQIQTLLCANSSSNKNHKKLCEFFEALFEFLNHSANLKKDTVMLEPLPLPKDEAIQALKLSLEQLYCIRAALTRDQNNNLYKKAIKIIIKDLATLLSNNTNTADAPRLSKAEVIEALQLSLGQLDCITAVYINDTNDEYILTLLTKIITNLQKLFHNTITLGMASESDSNVQKLQDLFSENSPKYEVIGANIKYLLADICDNMHNDQQLGATALPSSYSAQKQLNNRNNRKRKPRVIVRTPSENTQHKIHAIPTSSYRKKTTLPAINSTQITPNDESNNTQEDIILSLITEYIKLKIFLSDCAISEHNLLESKNKYEFLNDCISHLLLRDGVNLCGLITTYIQHDICKKYPKLVVRNPEVLLKIARLQNECTDKLNGILKKFSQIFHNYHQLIQFCLAKLQNHDHDSPVQESPFFFMIMSISLTNDGCMINYYRSEFLKKQLEDIQQRRTAANIVDIVQELQPSLLIPPKNRAQSDRQARAIKKLLDSKSFEEEMEEAIFAAQSSAAKSKKYQETIEELLSSGNQMLINLIYNKHNQDTENMPTAFLVVKIIYALLLREHTITYCSKELSHLSEEEFFAQYYNNIAQIADTVDKEDVEEYMEFFYCLNDIEANYPSELYAIEKLYFNTSEEIANVGTYQLVEYLCRNYKTRYPIEFFQQPFFKVLLLNEDQLQNTHPQEIQIFDIVIYRKLKNASNELLKIILCHIRQNISPKNDLQPLKDLLTNKWQLSEESIQNLQKTPQNIQTRTDKELKTAHQQLMLLAKQYSRECAYMTNKYSNEILSMEDAIKKFDKAMLALNGISTTKNDNPDHQSFPGISHHSVYNSPPLPPRLYRMEHSNLLEQPTTHVRSVHTSKIPPAEMPPRTNPFPVLQNTQLRQTYPTTNDPPSHDQTSNNQEMPNYKPPPPIC